MKMQSEPKHKLHFIQTIFVIFNYREPQTCYLSQNNSSTSVEPVNGLFDSIHIPILFVQTEVVYHMSTAVMIFSSFVHTLAPRLVSNYKESKLSLWS